MATVGTKRKTTKPLSSAYQLLRGQGRLSVWEKARGMWRNRKPDPIKELQEIRKGWIRDREK
jgi:hypothetical protein